MNVKKVLSVLLVLAMLLSAGAVAEGANPFTDPNVTAPGTLPICVERGTVSIAVAQNTNVIDYDTNWSVNWLEERDNVDIVWDIFPATDAAQKFDLMVAAGSKLADVTTIGLNDSSILKYGSNGVIIPLNDYYDQGAAAFLNARMEEVGQPNFLNYLASADGNIYVLGRNNTSFGNIVAHRAWLNITWLETLNLEEPQTIEELLNALRAFRDQDPNGNGEQDEIPMVGCEGGWATDVFAYILNWFDYYDARGNYHVVENGVLDVVYDRETYRDALRLAKQMVDEKLLNELSFTQDMASYNAMVASDPMLVGVAVSGSASGFGANTYDYKTLLTIEGPEGHKATTLVPQVPGAVCAITSSCEHPDLAFRLMESLYGDEQWETIQYLGQPDVDWTSLTDEEREEYDIGIPGNQFVLRLNIIHGQLQNSNLQQGVFPTLTTSAGIPQFVVADEEGNVDMELLKRTREGNQRYAALKEYFPKEVVEKIVYTLEESEEWNEMRTVILQYVDECQARFILGDLDIENDWDSYLAELEAMGYKELLETDRTAYYRTIGR